MAMININRENADVFYRYKMPSLIAKVEGKGNGIKTVVVNMVEIGKALGRPPSYPCKFFGCELGAQTQMDTKIGRYIVNGAHDGPRLQELLDGFIKKFVLCVECDNPETELVIQQSKGRILRVCRACGGSGLVDLRHKLIPFIFKNPPNGEESTGGKKDKRARRQEKGKKREKEPTSPTTTNTNHSTPAAVTTTAAAGNEGFMTADQNGLVTDEKDLDDWSVDTSKEAVKSRMEKLAEGASALALTDDLEKSSSERLDIFYKFVEDIKKNGVPAVASSLPKIKAEAERLDVMDMAAGIMAELLYTDKLLTQIEEYRPIMLHFVVSNHKGQKRVLEAFEILVSKVYPQLMPKVPHILKAFYDCDILEEEVILEWHEKVSKKHIGKEKAKEIREKAAPFVNWLKTAEEESSGEEDDVEVVYSDRQTSDKLTVVSEPQKSEQKEEEEEEDDQDLDIDAI